MSFAVFTAVSRGTDLCLIFAPLMGYDEPKSSVGNCHQSVSPSLTGNSALRKNGKSSMN